MSTYEQVGTVLEELWAEELDREDGARREAEVVLEGERRWVRERREVSVEEAARVVGIEKGSVKKRVQRGKLRSEKDARGATWVWLDRSETVRDGSQGRSQTERDELVGELRDRISYLERQVEDEKEARRRADTLLAQLTQANAALAARVPELAPAQDTPPEPAGGDLRASEGSDRGP
jgi:hypothetical protein